MYSRLRLRVQDLLNRMIDKWPPMLRLVVLALLPALGSMGPVIANSVAIRLRANNRGNRGSRARNRRFYRRLEVRQWGTID